MSLFPLTCRRLREKNQANTKKFMDERKNNMLKQNKKKEKQKKTHETQLQDIITDLTDVSMNHFVDSWWSERTGGKLYQFFMPTK